MRDRIEELVTELEEDQSLLQRQINHDIYHDAYLAVVEGQSSFHLQKQIIQKLKNILNNKPINDLSNEE